MAELERLEVLLYDQPIGSITNLYGDKNLFVFNQEYCEQEKRATLSLSLKDIHGDLIAEIKSTRVRLPPFFSNLLPEGALRQYLASQAEVSEVREFYLLGALGEDLPGAIKIKGYNKKKVNHQLPLSANRGKVLHFSLAGVQWKFSVIREGEKVRVPEEGVGGDWILKLPHMEYGGVPENEYSMMELARLVGIDVPKTALIALNQIEGLPHVMKGGSNAFLIKRFDRAKGEKIHIEDFAQVFGVYPERKYESASYQSIGRVIHSTIGEEGIVEFIRRLVFNVLIGNGDMHLKNWSLIYPDRIHAGLAPAYDFVSTIPYIPSENLALSFVDSKAFSSLTDDQLKRFCAKASLPEKVVLETAYEVVAAFKEHWHRIYALPIDRNIIKLIEAHIKTIPLVI